MTKHRLTHQERNEILALLSAGYSRTTAAKYIHRAPVTLRSDIAEHPKFAQQVAKAEEGSEVFYLSCIRKAALKEQYWRAAAWVLERRLPNRYGTQKPETMTAEQVQKFMTTCIEIIVNELPDDEQRKNIFNRLTKELAKWD
jgi:IS30 family transposase